VSPCHGLFFSDTRPLNVTSQCDVNRQAHTHAHPRLTMAAAEAAGRYGHVLFPSGTHAPALELAEKLLDTVGKGWAERVFYSDNGSTGMEVALKMALRSSGRRYGWEGVVGENVGVIGLKGGYHGDTVCLGVFPKSAILR
jgi:dethiobiotin synthetase/adenosylmethionine--8-amino-7-oxononanoate aminotransferase